MTRHEKTTHVHVSDNGEYGTHRHAEGRTLLVAELEGLDWASPARLSRQVAGRNDALAAARDALTRPASQSVGGSVTAFGLLPFPSLPHALAEAERVLDELKLDGVMIVPMVAGHSLDNDEYAPLLSLLDAAGARVLLHPAESDGRALVDESHLDAAFALSRLIYRDRVRRLTGLRLAIAHDEGVVDFLAENIGILHYLQEKRMRLGAFLVDFIVKKELKGERYLRAIEAVS